MMIEVPLMCHLVLFSRKKSENNAVWPHLWATPI